MARIFCSDEILKSLYEVAKAYLYPLHIKALIEGKMINGVLIDKGAMISLLPESMLQRFGKGNKDLVRTNVAVIYYNGKSIAVKGVVKLNVRVGIVD